MTSRGHDVTLWPHTGTAHAPDTAELVTENISDVSATVRPLFDFVVVYDGRQQIADRQGRSLLPTIALLAVIEGVR